MTAGAHIAPLQVFAAPPSRKSVVRLEANLIASAAEEIMTRLVVVALFVCLILSAQCFVQSINATVSGTVTDLSGAVLLGVSVTATNNGTGVVTSVVSTEAGAYNFASLLPGVYKVSA